MSVILMILGWILKLIGILLGTFLLIILILLITPIRYELQGTKDSEIQYGAKITWLFRFLQFYITQTKVQRLRQIKILGFRVSEQVDDLSPVDEEAIKDFTDDLWETDWQEMEEEEFKERLFRYFNEPKPNTMPEIPATAQGDEAKKPLDSKESVIESTPLTKADINGEKEDAAVFSKAENPPAKADRSEVSPHALQKDRDETDEIIVFDEADEEQDNPEEPISDDVETDSELASGFHKLKAKIDFAWEIFNLVREYFRQNKGLIKHLVYWIYRVIRSVLPKKIEGNVHFGLSDPSNTGYALGIFYLFYPSKHGKIEIKPNFDEFILEGTLKIKGRVLFIEIIYYLLRLVFDIKIFRLLLLALKINKKIKSGKEAEDTLKQSTGFKGS